MISHRGRINGVSDPENKIISIKKFINTDIEIIEIDINWSREKIFILNHDELIDKKYIFKINYKELKEKFNIALLDDVLNLIEGKKKIYFDIKYIGEDYNDYKLFWKELEKILNIYVEKYKCNHNDIYIGTFYKNHLDYILKLKNNYRKGILLYDENINMLIQLGKDINKLDFISIDYNILEKIEKYYNKKIIICYTINNKEIFKKINKLDYIQGIVSDNCLILD